MTKLIYGQNNHVKGKINTNCSCEDCAKRREKVKDRIARRFSARHNPVFKFHKFIPFFKFTAVIDIKIGKL